MGDPVTIGMIGAGVGALMDKEKPLRGAALGGLGGWGGATMMGVGAAGGAGGAVAGGGTVGSVAALQNMANPAAGAMMSQVAPATNTASFLSNAGAGSQLTSAVGSSATTAPQMSGMGLLDMPTTLTGAGLTADKAMRFASMMNPGGGQQQQQQPRISGSVGGGRMGSPQQFAQISPYASRQMPSGALSTAKYFGG